MPSMRAVLETRQKAAAAQVKHLEAELERVRAALGDAGKVHRRRVIGLEQYLKALAEEDASADVAGEMSQKKVVGPRRAVPHRQHASEVMELSPDYRALMAAAVDAGDDGLGARRAAVVLGWDSATVSRVEGARARLKRLVERGWLVEAKPGKFTLPVPPSRQDAGAGGQAAAHEHGHRPQDDGFAGVGATFVVADQAPAAQKPGERSSTTQRRGSIWNPRVLSLRRTTSRTISSWAVLQSTRCPVRK
ncbi:hypothetical protein ACFFKE_00755 [Streptomyces mutabilis]|uniref:hypothetical protein n=1 Tax=Streptomyces mutabilis TaxID=67332 RepID=UPI0019A070ED|nr:hypothetical protein GCM10010279_05440 [Streptomyces mutabilis]